LRITTGGRQPSFGADLVGLAHHGVEHRVFRALGQHEVVAVHLRRTLQGAIDAAVALLHPARIPGHIEVHQALAVVLQVHALPGRIGGDQDPQRIGLGWAVEAALDRFAPLITDAAVEGGESGLGLITAGDQLAHAPLQPVLGVGVLGEDQQPFAGPFRTRLSQAGAEVLADQLLQPPHAAVGLIPSCLGNLLHLAQQLPVVVGGLQG
jgi:hypothetical protein